MTPHPTPSRRTMQVKVMRDVAGEVGEAGPSIAVQMLGLSSVPQAGDEFTVFASEGEARAAGA